MCSDNDESGGKWSGVEMVNVGVELGSGLSRGEVEDSAASAVRVANLVNVVMASRDRFSCNNRNLVLFSLHGTFSS